MLTKCSIPCLIPKPLLKITRTRSTQQNFTAIISNFWACSCRLIHKRLLLCSVFASLHVSDKKNKNKIKKRWQKFKKKTLKNVTK